MRIKLRRNIAALTLGAALTFGGGLSEMAQAFPLRQEAAQADGLPLVLLFTPRQAGAKLGAKNDPNVALRILMRDALRDSGRYRALSFQANDPVIVRAMREHTLAAADIVEPISPEAMQRIAKALGAVNILSLDSTLTQTALTTQIRLLREESGDVWRAIYDEQTTTALTTGRKRLKFEAVIDIAADPALTRLGLPSRSAQDLTTTKPLALNKPTKKERETLAQAERERLAALKKEKQAKADKERAARNADSAGSKSNGKANAQDDATNDNGTSRAVNPKISTGPKSNGSAANSKSNSANSKSNPSNQSNNANGKTAPLIIMKPETAPFSDFSTDGAAGRDALAARPNVAPPPALAPIDPEAAIARYREAGDMANVIASLRRAINDHPRDTLLRRQLIQAYQDRQMSDAALEETNRALLLMPEDAALRRMRGDALLAKGDLNGALTAYRDAIKRDPNDVTTQVALADALLADSQFAEAQAAYQAAAKSDPKSPLPHRRLANALARRAVGDSSLYAASLDELKQAQTLSPTTDSGAYLNEYTGLARLMESRLRDLLNELQNDFQAQQQGKMTGDALKRALADLKLRGEAAADYLDKLPPASGLDVTHAHYQQGAALLLQAVSLFRDYAVKPDDSTLTAMKGAQADAHRELAAGAKSLAATKSDAAGN